MTFSATLGALAEELIEVATGLSPQTGTKRYSAIHNATLRGLKSQSYLRINQFDVTKTLDGLEERFRVYNRDELADAFRTSLNNLNDYPSRWNPEILAFLLELSDQPTFKTKLSDLDVLHKVEEDEPAPLRWQDIAREDGWDLEDDIWKTIDYRDISKPESENDEEEQTTEESDEASLFEEIELPIGRTARDCIVKPADTELLMAIREVQEWRNTVTKIEDVRNPQKMPLAETHVIREIIFMLQGLQTTIFNDTTRPPAPTFQIENVSWETYRALAYHFAESGHRITLLRRFVSHPQVVPHLQAFQDCIASRLRDFDRKLSRIETSFAVPKDRVMLTLLAVNAEIAPWLDPLVLLSRTIDQIKEASSTDTFRYLELLYDETSLAQLRGDMTNYKFFARIFIECFNVYLRPIRLWMDEGKLLPGSDIFFISESLTDIPLSKVWQDRFKLRETADGQLHTPNFLRPAARQIFNAGKNIVVLKLLGKYDPISAGQNIDEPPLDYETVCPDDLDLATFPVLFGAAFNRWIQSKYQRTSSTLKDALLDECGLVTTLNALQALYLMADGFAASTFSNYLFYNLENLNPVWYDQFALTGVAQDAYMPLVDSSRLFVSVNTAGTRMTVEDACSSVKPALPHVKINYRLSWAVRNIISEESTGYYQSIFALLLQLRRTSYSLQKLRILDNVRTDFENWDERSLFYSARGNLLWFCTTIHTYLATLVLEPNKQRLRHELLIAEDVDTMISTHTTILKQMVDQACLGSMLTPIREYMLDVLDLAIKLDQARERNTFRGGAAASRFFAKESDDKYDRETEDKESTYRERYIHELEGINADFNRHLRVICTGLKSFARATSDANATKWDILADMLQMGHQNMR